MSGDIEFGVNTQWFDSVQADVGFHRLFAKFLAFFADHPNYTIVSYGTGKSETGTGTPTSWKAWADSDGSGVPPFADNSWFVAMAQKASATLNGDGTRKWCVKFQFTSTTPFDDCNKDDDEYGVGTEGQDHVLFARFAPDGGWANSPNGNELTFIDDSSHTPSDNLQVATHGDSAVNFNLHIQGDDDTVVWEGHLVDSGTALPYYAYQRLGYLGETTRRSASHLKPELAIIASMTAGGGHILGKGSNEAGTRVFNRPQDGTTVVSFSLDVDNEPVTRHRFFTGSNGAAADNDLLWNGAADPWSDDDEFLAIIVRQDQDDHNSIIGQLRLVESAGSHISEGSLFGDGTRLSVGYDTAARGGIAAPWPGSGTAPVF